MMKDHENRLTSEAIDRQTERLPGELSQEEHHLIQDIYALSQAYAQENERSLERIWSRFMQSREHPVFLQEKQRQQSGGQQLSMEGKAMHQRDIYQDTYISTLNSQQPHRSRFLRRTLSTIGVAAVVLFTILSWVLLSSALHSKSQNPPVGSRQTTQTGAAQKAFSSGALLCSFSGDNSAVTHSQQPSLDWSSHGQIATTYANLKTFAASNCAPTSSDLLPLAQQANWSPDGKQLLVLNQAASWSEEVAEVLDATTGQRISSFTGGGPYDSVYQSVWSSNGTQIVSLVITYHPKTSIPPVISVRIWNASTGAFIRTAVTFPSTLQFNVEFPQVASISPNGKYVSAQKSNNTIGIWSIDSGKQTGSIPFNQSDVSAEAWSPDGASLALGLFTASKVQIWSAATGKLSASFKDSDTSLPLIGALAWSPDGKYLAESTSAIHIWDVKAQKIVATFGKVEQGHEVTTLAWSPDSHKLVSSTNEFDGKNYALNTVNLWKLS